jgi:hypothetical protein
MGLLAKDPHYFQLKWVYWGVRPLNLIFFRTIMPRTRLTQAMLKFQVHRAGSRRLLSKELDLFLLAGCSCLLTLLYHPVADALAPQSSISGSQKVPAQVNSVNFNGTVAPFHLTLPPEREDLIEKES